MRLILTVYNGKYKIDAYEIVLQTPVDRTYYAAIDIKAHLEPARKPTPRKPKRT